MSFVLWTDEEDGLDLGDPFDLFKAFAEMAKAGADEEEYAELFLVPRLGEQEVPPAYLAHVREQASRFLDEHEGLSKATAAILETLADGAVTSIKSLVDLLRKGEFREEDHPRADDGKFSTGGGQSSESGSGGESRHREHFLSSIDDSLSSSDISEEQRELFAKASRRIAESLPARALELIGTAVTSVAHYRTEVEVKEAYFADIEQSQGHMEGFAAAFRKLKKAMASAKPLGFFSNETGTLVLNGGSVASGDYGFGDNAEDAITGAHAHEISHAIDKGRVFSSSKPWGTAFVKELKKGQLTKYGGSSTVEGFAEFGRVLYTRPELRDRLETDFPMCSQFFRDNGLWPDK